ncbi:MAG: HNH endonuclease [Niallia sp.]
MEENFRTDKRGIDGYGIRCNDCKPIKTQYYLNNREKQRNKSSEYFTENKDRLSEVHLLYREGKRNELKAATMEWAKYNPSRFKENTKRWQQTHPEVISEYNKFRMMHKIHGITKEEWEKCKQYFNYSCAYCGMTEEKAYDVYRNKLHKEHVDHEGNNDISNCIPSCKGCNCSKHTSDMVDWFTGKKEIYNKDRLVKIFNWINGDCFKPVIK